jgi:hypothetical protein
MAQPAFYQNLMWQGIGTLSVTVPNAGPYFVEGKISLPTITGGGGPSSLVVTVNQNGSPVYVGAAGASGFRTEISCAVNDVIAMVFSSAAAVDNALNAIKANIEIGQGM